MRTRNLLRAGVAATLAAVLMSTVHSSQADEPEWYEGLPDATFGNWANASQGGISYAKRAKQWFRSPDGIGVAEVIFGQDDDPQARADGDGWFRVEAYFVSPPGAPANYGYLAPMTVRSVGFGLIPVEATVQVSQRFENGYPVPIRTMLQADFTRTPTPEGSGAATTDAHYPSATISDRLNVRILSVRVDGVDLELNGECRTVKPAPVTLRTPAYSRLDTQDTTELEWYRTHDPAKYWHPLWGGQFSGTMTIPPFTGCTTTAGDDLSDLLTLSASGPDNPISARSGWPCQFQKDGSNAPPPPGASTPKLAAAAGGVNQYGAGCPGVKPFLYPARGDG